MNRRSNKKTIWKRSLLAVLAVLLFGFSNITVLGVELTSVTISGDGDFVIWYISPQIEKWITYIYATGQSDVLDRITFV